MREFKFFFVFVILILGVSFAITINVLLSSDNTVFNEQMYEGYVLASKTLDNAVFINFVSITKSSTNVLDLKALLNNNPVIISTNFYNLQFHFADDLKVVSTYPTLKYPNPYPSPQDEIKALKYQLRNAKRLLFIYNANNYAYTYLKALETLEDKIIFVKKYDKNDNTLNQMIDKNSIDTIMAFLSPIELKNLLSMISNRSDFLNKIKVVAFSFYDYFNFIKEYKEVYDGLYFVSILDSQNTNLFYESYVKQFGHPPTEHSAAAYDSIFIMNSILKNEVSLDASSKILLKHSKVERPLYFYKVEESKINLISVLKY